MAYRGKTFSPAQDWIDGGPEFAERKLQEVARFLEVLAGEANEGSRHKRRRNRQHRYDLEDAATTIRDALHYMGTDIALSAEETSALVSSVLGPERYPVFGGSDGAEGIAEQIADRLNAYSQGRFGVPWVIVRPRPAQPEP